MDVKSYFATQSLFTDPGEKSGLYADLPGTAEELCGVVQGLLLDYTERCKYPIVNERLLDTNSRYVSVVLRQILALDKNPLTQARAEADRFTASCSDFANLFCSMARGKGIAARKRVGFFACDCGAFCSHEIVEYFDEADSCWKQIAPTGIDTAKFIPAAEAWQQVRSGAADPAMFRNEESSGLTLVLANLMLDLASVNKLELLGWDRYGWMLRPINDFSDRAWETLDKAAELLRDVDGSLDALIALYDREEGLQVPRVIWCATPLVPPHKVTLTF